MDALNIQSFPLYGFVTGDVSGLFLNFEGSETFQVIKNNFLQASEIRTGYGGNYQVHYRGEILPDTLKLQDSQVKPFERVHLIKQQQS